MSTRPFVGRARTEPELHLIGVLGRIFSEPFEFLEVHPVVDLLIGSHSSHHLEVFRSEFFVRVVLPVALFHMPLRQFNRFGFAF